MLFLVNIELTSRFKYNSDMGKFRKETYNDFLNKNLIISDSALTDSNVKTSRSANPLIMLLHNEKVNVTPKEASTLFALFNAERRKIDKPQESSILPDSSSEKSGEIFSHENKRFAAEDIASEVFVSKKVSLTPRERQVIAEMVNGKSNSDVSHELNMALRTVRIHLTNIYKKSIYRSDAMF